MSEQLIPRIYVASLSDYNAGRLHGCWIDATQPIEEVWTEVNAMLAASPLVGAEEWAIHDFEDFGPLRLGEYDSLEQVACIGSGIAEHGVAYAIWADHVGSSQWAERLDEFADHYQGRWDSARDWAEELLDGIGIDLDASVPDFLAPYVRLDIEAFAADLALDYVVVETSDGVYVFDQ